MIHDSGACFYVRMRRRTEDKYTVKVGTSPVSGYKCYSVFQRGRFCLVPFFLSSDLSG